VSRQARFIETRRVLGQRAARALIEQVAETEGEDRRYATGLAAVRRAAALTQDAVAAKLSAAVAP
jgi:hypothetical protein